MLNDLLEMLGGGDEDGERGCCQQRQRAGEGIRGYIARLFSGDDDDNDGDRGRDGRCCSGVNGRRDSGDPASAGQRRDRHDQNDGFDFGD